MSEENIKYNFTGDSDSITIHRIDETSGKVDSAVITADDTMFSEVRAELLDGDTKRAYDLASREVLYREVELVDDINFDGQQITYQFGGIDYPVDNTLTRRLLEYIGRGEGNEAYRLSAFMSNLMHNPSPASVNELYLFLEAADIKITRDGHFLAFKRVRNNYRDIHSGKFDNSVGATPEMPRHMVDGNRYRTCSRGLHVCSRAYLRSFGSSGNDRIMLVRVNPADVVSVPSDHNNEKMRVWRYEVVAEIGDGNVDAIVNSFVIEERADEFANSPVDDDSAEDDLMTNEVEKWPNDEQTDTKEKSINPHCIIAGFMARITARKLASLASFAGDDLMVVDTGGRGIKNCPRWLVIDRLNGYEPTADDLEMGDILNDDGISEDGKMLIRRIENIAPIVEIVESRSVARNHKKQHPGTRIFDRTRLFDNTIQKKRWIIARTQGMTHADFAEYVCAVSNLHHILGIDSMERRLCDS